MHDSLRSLKLVWDLVLVTQGKYLNKAAGFTSQILLNPFFSLSQITHLLVICC